MKSEESPVTKKDLSDAIAEIRKFVRETQAQSEHRILAFVREMQAESEHRILDRTQEFVRDAQTEILRGFERYVAGADIQFRRLKADFGNLDTATEKRIEIVEKRLTQIEKRLVIGGDPRPRT
ncbi:MAG: hypothetical protein ABI165_10300 [Bryobacteraceae bacterium]